MGGVLGAGERPCLFNLVEGAVVACFGHTGRFLTYFSLIRFLLHKSVQEVGFSPAGRYYSPRMGKLSVDPVGLFQQSSVDANSGLGNSVFFSPRVCAGLFFILF